jgi:hypothetical protein
MYDYRFIATNSFNAVFKRLVYVCICLSPLNYLVVFGNGGYRNDRSNISYGNLLHSCKIPSKPHLVFCIFLHVFPGGRSFD